MENPKNKNIKEKDVCIKRSVTDKNYNLKVKDINNLPDLDGKEGEIGNIKRSYTVLVNDAITDKDVEFLKKFKVYCETMKLSVVPYSDDLLIRFIKSARYKIKDAHKRFVEYIKFSKNYDIFNIQIEIFPNIDKIKLFYPHNFHKTSMDGEPVFIQMLGELKVNDINELLPEPLLTKYIVYKIIELEKIIFPKCSEKYNRTINKVFCIVDLLGLTTSLMNKNVLNFLLKQMNIVSRYFPGILGSLYFVNTGLLFRSIWAPCKFFYNSLTRSRIKLLSFKYKEELLKKIEPNNLPKFIGGNCNCDPYGCFFSNIGPWNEEISIGEKRRKVNYLEKIRFMTEQKDQKKLLEEMDLDDQEQEEENDEEDEKKEEKTEQNKQDN